MPEIMSKRARLTEKTSSSTASSSSGLPPSPYLGSNQPTYSTQDSPLSTPSGSGGPSGSNISNVSGGSNTLNSANGANGLSPPPPTHYLRNKGHLRETEESIRLLKKRSQIYEARKSRPPSLRQVESDEGLLFGCEFHHQWNLETSSRGRTVVIGSSLRTRPEPHLHRLGGRRLSFLDIDPTSPPPPLPTFPTLPTLSTPPYLFDNDTSPPSFSPPASRDGHSHSHSSNSNSNTWGSFDSSLGSSLDSRAMGPKTKRPSRICRSRRARSTDSSFSISSTDSTNFGTSVEQSSVPPSPFDPPALPPSITNIGNPIMISPEIHIQDCQPNNCNCNGLRPQTAPSSSPSYSLSDVQKRRRAVAFNQFTTYSEAFPFHRTLHSNLHPNLVQSNNKAITSTDTDTEDIPEMTLPKVVHTVQSVPDFRSNSIHTNTHTGVDPDPDPDTWPRHVDHIDGHGFKRFKDTDRPPKPKARRKSSVGFIHGLKSLINYKHGSHHPRQ